MQSPLADPVTETSPAGGPAPAPDTGAIHRPRRAWLCLLFAILLAAFASFLWLSAPRQSPVDRALPIKNAPETAGVLRLKGTTQAVNTHAVQAPVLAGDKEGTLTITRLRTAGSSIHAGDLLVEFDREAQLRDFLDKQAQYNKMSDDVLQEQAKESAARAKDETEMRTAEGDLGKAQLEIQKVELMSRIDAEKGRENLEEAKATLDQLKQTFSLKRNAAQASVRILEIQRDRARETMLHAQANAALMQVHSPMAGVVVLNTIWKQGNLGEVQEGDQVRPGVPFMQVVDPSAMEVLVPVNQQDVLALHDGQQAKIHLDAYPDLVCPARLEVIDPMGTAGDFSDKVRSFPTTWSVQCTDPRLLPGLSVAVDVAPAKPQAVNP